ncbi:MAG: AraC family transcriptional regulator [Arachidicoccus sp.]|nr:AraC family transcriptional regulator [Arachidicoccus sp.]
MKNAYTNAKKNIRIQQVSENYFKLLDKHLEDLISGREMKMMNIQEISQKLFVSHKYLIEIIKEKYHQHPCHFYDEKILNKAKSLLSTTHLTVAEIARMLTYDPSNFSKFFKKYIGLTPIQFRNTQSTY